MNQSHNQECNFWQDTEPYIGPQSAQWGLTPNVKLFVELGRG